jgi:DNA-binding CsgD family transcriptional regulator
LRTEFEELASLLLEYPGELAYGLANARVESRLLAGDVAGAREQLPPAHYSAITTIEEAMICSLRALVELAGGDRDAAEREFRVMNEVNAANPGARDAAGWLYTNDSVSTLGEAFVELGEPTVLRAWFDSEPSRAPFTRSDSPLLTYGLVGVALGEHERASEALEELLAVTRREGTPIIEGRCHEGLAEVAAARGEHHAALAELKAAEACFEPHGTVLLLERVEARREELQGSAGAKRGPDGLSAREVEVLRLVAEGQSNRAIADELVLSIRTVERHIANIYAKTDTHNRAQATAYAVRQNLD